MNRCLMCLKQYEKLIYTSTGLPIECCLECHRKEIEK